MRPMMAMQPAPRLQIFPRGEGQGREVIYQLMSAVPDCLLSQAWPAPTGGQHAHCLCRRTPCVR